MPRQSFGDDFFTHALSRAQSPLGEFLQTATPKVGSVASGNPIIGHVDFGAEVPRSGVNLGGSFAVGNPGNWGTNDFLGGWQKATQFSAAVKAKRAEAAKTGEQPKPGQPTSTAAAPGTPTPQAVQQNVVGGVIPSEGVDKITLAGLGPQQRQEFWLRSMALGQVLEKETGIPAEIFAAMAANESNFGSAPGNIMGGVKAARDDPNALWLDTWEMEGGQRVNRREPFVASGTALEGMRRVAQTLQSGRYAAAYTALQNGAISPETFIWQVNQAGYASNPNWATREITPLMQEARGSREASSALLQSIQNDQLTRDSAVMHATAPRGLSQYDMGLSRNIADAFCGPAAAVDFVRQFGRNPTTMEALNLAKEVGWNENRGMAGPQSQVNLLNRLGVPARLAAPDPNTIQNEVAQGRPVIIDTPGHYYQIIGYNERTGGFVMGDAVGRRAGQNGIRLENLSSLGFGAARTAILANPDQQPAATPTMPGEPAPSTANPQWGD